MSNLISYLISVRDFFFGGVTGGHELSAYLIGGVAEMRAICVQGGRGGQKRPKNCVHTISMAPCTDDVTAVTAKGLFYDNQIHQEHQARKSC